MATSRKWHMVMTLAVVVTTGCAVKNPDMLHFLREDEFNVSATEYRVGIPDSISISAPRVLEIDGAAQAIQPNGKISLRLLGDVKVVGMTAKEIAAKLEVLLSRYYVDPKVSVNVGFRSKKYYVYGETSAKGARPYTGRDTLLDAVLGSGMNYMAWTSRVKVIRPARGDTTVRTIEVNVDEMLKTGDWSRNILLEPNDIVYIPPTPPAWLMQRLRDIIFPITPVIEAYTMPAYLRSIEDVYSDENGYNYYGGSGGSGGFGGGSFRP